MESARTDPSVRCAIHDLAYCSLCYPPVRPRRGRRRVDVPAGSYVEVKGGNGVYHHPDCHNVTGNWDGADQAQLGDLMVWTGQEIQQRGLRPAGCCQPPDVTLR